ncbi:alpha/beta hydrolase [Ilyomonas limi]|uniref:Alpha/beta hydrolase n=1 Tax=Ilyomonas limi TaxID=2575867 RepID=A0A4U3L9E7_9BACT|nr:alpha/beta hydrolase [Ilyomonas limi]TKK71730.1 alpha/beta hydrolase [Ilyomonas limi]
MPALNQYFLTLIDGRKLSYALYGPINGKPVFYFHGTPSSRLEPLLLNVYVKSLEQSLQQYNIQLIAVDRPGIGLSTYNLHNSFSSFAGDVQQLATHLHISSAGVLGWSGAGPFALSVAFHFPKLITAIYLITTFTKSFGEPAVFKVMHANKYYFGTAKYAPWLLRAIMNIVSKKPARKPMPKWLSGLPKVDYDCMNTPECIQHLSAVTICESCITGSRGSVQEASLYFNPTGYDIAQIQQPIHFWWGTADNVVPIIHAKAIAEHVPNANIHYKQDEGHLSIYIHYFEEVLAAIAKQ